MAKFKTKYAVFAMPFVNLTYLVIAVVTADLIRVFPAHSPQTIMLTLSLPALTSIFGIFIVPALTPHFSKKALGLFGLLLTLVGGIICYIFYYDLNVLIIASALLGVAYGFLSPAYTLLIGQSFEGDTKSFMMGLSGAIMNIGRLIIVFIAGFLAVIKWNYVFFTYIFVAIATVIVLIMLPKDAPVAKGENGKQIKLNGKVYFYGLVGLLFTIVYYVNATHTSLYIEGNNLGTPAVTGTITSLTCGIAVFSSVFYGKLVKIAKRYTLFIAFFIMGAGFICAGLFVNLFGIFAAMLSAAVAMSFLTPYLTVSVTNVVDSYSVAAATSIVLALMNLGYFVSPTVIDLLCRFVGQTAPSWAFLIGGVISLIVGLFTLTER